MINPQWLQLPISGTNFHGPKEVQAIEVRLYEEKIMKLKGISEQYFTVNKYTGTPLLSSSVVQSMISLTSSLVIKMLTVLVSTISSP